MTRMAEHDDQEFATYHDEEPRSIFSALWFRALVVLLVLGVVAAVAVPYALDVMTASTAKSPVAFRPPPAAVPPQPAAPVPTPMPAPSATAAAAPSGPDALKPDTAKPEPPTSQMRMPEPPRPARATPEISKAVAAKPDKPPEVAEGSKPNLPAKGTEAARAVETAKPAEPRAAEPRRPAPTPRVAVARPAARDPATARGAVSGTAYWVQVGAFRDEASAKRLADRLREQNFAVEQSTRTRRAPASAPTATADRRSMSGDRYNVFVSGLAPSELTTKLTARGLTAQPVAGGVMVTPSMPLREAVALSKDLAAGGLRVQVRRVTSAGAAGNGPSPSASPASSGEVMHRVRVGGFADRAAAVAAAKELEAKGFKVYIARGNQ